MKFVKKIIKLILIIFMIIIIFNNLTKKKRDAISSDEKLIKTTKKDKCDDHCQYCDTKWTHLERKIYFKNSNQFYLIDKSLFHTFFLTNTPNLIFPLKFQLKLSIYLKEKLLTNHTSNEIILDRPWSVEAYGLGSISHSLELKSFLYQHYNIDLIKSLKDISVNFYYCYSNTNKCIEKPLKLILKYLRTSEDSKINISLACTKCIYTKPDEVNYMRYWIEANRLSGFDKLSICNNSLPNTREYKELFEKNYDFIELEQLDCVPNFLPKHASYYVTNLTQIGPLFNQDPISGLRVNECYMQNVDKYKYIFVGDNDEAILTPKIKQIQTLSKFYRDFSSLNLDTSEKINNYMSSLTCDRFSNNQSKIESFIKYLVEENSLKKPQSYNFDQIYFIKQRMIQKFFNKFEIILKEKNFSYPISININNVDKINPNVYGLRDEEDLEAFYFTLEIKNENEFNYASNLYYFNKYFVKPFFKKYELFINSSCKRYNRAFAFASFTRNGNKIDGKTIHNTQTTYTLTLHEPYASDYLKISYEHGYYSHFRSNFHFNKEKKPGSVSDLIIDLSYFKCYFIPMIKNFASEH